MPEFLQTFHETHPSCHPVQSIQPSTTKDVNWNQNVNESVLCVIVRLLKRYSKTKRRAPANSKRWVKSEGLSTKPSKPVKEHEKGYNLECVIYYQLDNIFTLLCLRRQPVTILLQLQSLPDICSPQLVLRHRKVIGSHRNCWWRWKLS